jgi:HEAT repeat protein
MRFSLRVVTMLVSALCVLPALGQSASAAPKRPTERAWELLDKGVSSQNAETRRIAVSALGLISNNVHAFRIAEKALHDQNPEVRAVAATALGKMKSRASIPKLTATLDDKEPEVVLAAAQSLVSLKSEQGYNVYYEVLTGRRKGGRSAVEKELAIARNPKKLAEMGFEEGIGFVPFGGVGLQVFRALQGGSEPGVRAASAAMLAHDPDPHAATALSDAAGDPNWHVRVAAIGAIAERGDPKLLSPVLSDFADSKEAVRYSAAAAVVRLSTTKWKPRNENTVKTASLSRDSRMVKLRSVPGLKAQLHPSE